MLHVRHFTAGKLSSQSTTGRFVDTSPGSATLRHFLIESNWRSAVTPSECARGGHLMQDASRKVVGTFCVRKACLLQKYTDFLGAIAPDSITATLDTSETRVAMAS